jgi:hypothetical protein
MSQIADRARGLIENVAAGDFAAVEAALHTPFLFEGPFDTFRSPEPYLAALRGLHGIVESVKIHRVFESGGEACVLYDLITNGPAGTAFVAEWMRFRDGKIASVRAVFDARPFVAMFAGPHDQA